MGKKGDVAKLGGNVPFKELKAKGKATSPAPRPTPTSASLCDDHFGVLHLRALSVAVPSVVCGRVPNLPLVSREWRNGVQL